MTATAEQNMDLGVCPCGEQASWYRAEATSATAASPGAARSSISTIGIDDVTDNLCDGCYKGFTGSDDTAIAGWKRVDVLKRQSTAGEEDQSASDADDQSGAFAEDW